MRTNLTAAAWLLSLLMLLAGCSQTAVVTTQPSTDSTEASQSITGSSVLPSNQTPQTAVMHSETADPGANQTNERRLSAAAQAQFTEAKTLLASGQYAQAEIQLSALVAALPDAGGIRYNLALAQWQQAKLSEAQFHLKQLKPAQRQYANAMNLLGVIARQQGQFSEAEQYLQHALTADAELALAHKNLAFLYELYLGQLLKARYHYQQYYALTQDEQAKGWLVLLDQQLAQEQADD